MLMSFVSGVKVEVNAKIILIAVSLIGIVFYGILVEAIGICFIKDKIYLKVKINSNYHPHNDNTKKCYIHYSL